MFLGRIALFCWTHYSVYYETSSRDSWHRRKTSWRTSQDSSMEQGYPSSRNQFSCRNAHSLHWNGSKNWTHGFSMRQAKGYQACRRLAIWSGWWTYLWWRVRGKSTPWRQGFYLVRLQAVRLIPYDKFFYILVNSNDDLFKYYKTKEIRQLSHRREGILYLCSKLQQHHGFITNCWPKLLARYWQDFSRDGLKNSYFSLVANKQ